MSQSKPKQPPSFTFEAIGTKWVIDTNHQLPDDLINRIHDRIDTFDKHYSRFRTDSLITQMAQTAGSYTLPDDAQPLFDIYRQLYKITDGRFTPLIGQTLSDAGYDAQYSLKPSTDIAETPTWEDRLDYSYPTLIINEPVLLDVGAGGKGYLTDIISCLLSEDGITQFCINAGGDIVSKGAVAIALEDPDDTERAIGVASISDASLCGSAGNRRSWDKYHHIINPDTNESPREIKALWVVANTGLIADSLSTALFFVKPEVLQRDFTFEYAILHNDRSLSYSNNFPGEFFS